jgi:mannose-6-phosphate isomerase
MNSSLAFDPQSEAESWLYTVPRTALRFEPRYQPRLWGGRRLETLMHRRLPDATTAYGESWEICDRTDCESRVVEGDYAGLTLHDLWRNHRREVFGPALMAHPSRRYPLLMKILDACEDLSVQVHPPPKLAVLFGGEPKTEVWYVAATEPGSKVYAGLKKGVTEDAFVEAAEKGTCAEMLHSIQMQQGESMFVPSGRVHALGAGMIVFEIQQNSDTTYRVFDWNRVDADGKARELHLDVGLDCIDYRDIEPEPRPAFDNGVIAKCPFFEVLVRTAQINETRQLGEYGEHLVIVLVRGHAEMAGLDARPGDFLMIPASLDDTERLVRPKGVYQVKWLEIRIPTE